MKKKVYKKVILFVFVILFIALALFIKEKQFYDEILIEKGYEAYPSNDVRQGLDFKKADYYLNSKQEKLVNIPLIPGEKFEGIFFIKNHYLKEKVVNFVNFEIFDEKNENRFLVTFDTAKSFTLKPGEWKIVKYIITAPLNIKDGNYKGKIALTAADDVVKYSGTTNIVYAVANEFSFDISKNKVEKFYNPLTDLTLTPSKIASKYVYGDLKKLSSYGFAILSLFFIYFAIKADKRQKLKK